MATAGYSGTPLIKKLGIGPKMKVLLLYAPANYFSLLLEDITTQLVTARQTPDFIHLFAKDIIAFEKGMSKILTYTANNTSVIVWVSWYKKASGIVTNVNEDAIRNFALKNGLVDIKICAVDELWSGLKLVVPVEKR